MQRDSLSILERFIQQFEELSGLQICIYDYAFFSIESQQLSLPYLRRTHCSTYCKLVKSHPLAFKKCIETETMRAHQSTRQSTAYLHRCHAGVLDLTVPIIVGSQTVGAVFIGQCAPSESSKQLKFCNKVSKTYDLNKKALKQALAEAPNQDRATLKKMEATGSFIAEYIRKTLASAISNSILDATAVKSKKGTILMNKVPNFFLDRNSAIQAGAIKQALAHIRQNYWRNINQVEVAELVGLSESHFSRLFKKNTGMTFRRCIVEARISAAIWLIKKTDLKIKEIANLLNYNEPSSLQRAIQTHTGATVTELRQRQPVPWHMNRPDLMPG